ncbi:MAG: phenylacetate--CoA ligase family protein [Pirellulales bacterium]|nr:phenylacetate--CoA ligase family protein [Pirellulales bacterium]
MDDMDLFAPIVRRFIAPAWAVWERTDYLRDYRRLLRTQYDAPETIRQRQWEQISQLLDHAYRTTRFWKARFDEAGLEPDEVRTFDDFRRVPMLTKTDLRTRRDDMISDRFDAVRLLRRRTSGSTGVPVEVLLDEATNQFHRACTLRSDEWSGWKLGERMAAIWGNAAVEYRGRNWRGYLRNLLLHRATYLDSLNIDEPAMERFAAALRRRPPSLLYGHAHSIYLFATFLRARGIADIRPRAIISAAMVLHDWERKTLEEVFHCPVTNRYGCEEVALIACECERHQGLHVNAEGIYLEILQTDGGPAAPGELGTIVVTDLTNKAMPIIRYRIGDMGAMSGRRCACGRGLPLLERVEGRIADYVLTPGGRLVSGISLTDHFNTMVPGVVQMQIVQEEVDRFTFRIVRDDAFGPVSYDALKALVAEHFGPEAHFECEFTDRIPQEPSGKFRFCISKVSKDFGKSPDPLGADVQR